MESIDEIENMNVKELKAFIRRHGYVVTDVPRLDGTPGPAKKADLLKASKEIFHTHSKAEQSPASPHNPFQQRTTPNPTPVKNQTQTQAQTQTQTQTQTTSTTRRSLAADLDEHMDSKKTSKSTTTGGGGSGGGTASTTPGRKSHVSVNPQFAHLFGSAQPTANPTLNINRQSLPPFPQSQSSSVAPQSLPPARTQNPNRSSQPQPQSQPRSQSQTNRRATIAPQVLPDHTPPVPNIASKRLPPRNASNSNAFGAHVVPSMPQSNTHQQQQQRRVTTSGHVLGSGVSNSNSNKLSVPIVPTKNETTVTAKMPRRATIAPASINPMHRHQPPQPPQQQQQQQQQNNRTTIHRVPDDSPPATFPNKPKTRSQLQSQKSVPSPPPQDRNDDDVEMVNVHDEAMTSASEVESSVIDTDHDESDGAGSTIDTSEDDADTNLFATWSRNEIKTWLSQYKVPYNPTDDVNELRSVAQGHKMFLDSTNDVEIIPQPPKVINIDDDDEDGPTKKLRKRVISNNNNNNDNDQIEPAPSKSQKRQMQAERRQRTVPADDDDDDDGNNKINKHEFGDDDDVVYIAPSRRSKRRTKRKYRSQLDEANASKTKVRLSTRLMAAVLVLLSGFMVSSLGLALLSLYDQATMPYCDSVDTQKTTYINKSNETNGDSVKLLELDAYVASTNSTSKEKHSCRACPRHGQCEKGELHCLPGYVQLNGRCSEDEEFSLYAEILANEVYKLLKDISGQAVCGERKSKYLQKEEIKSVIQKGEIKRCKRQNSRSSIMKYLWTVNSHYPEYEELKFQSAMAIAFNILSQDSELHSNGNNNGENHKLFDISVRKDTGELASNISSISFWCRTRQILYENLGRVLLFVSLFILAVYMRIKMYIKKRYSEKLDALYRLATDELRTHKYDFENQMEDYAFIKDVVLRADIVGRATDANIRIWKDVEKRLNDDPRVLKSSRTIGGAPSYTFEWAGRRRSSSIGDGLSLSGSRRSSFGSRTSLDSLELSDNDAFGTSSSHSNQNFNGRNSARRGSFFGRSFWGSDRED